VLLHDLGDQQIQTLKQELKTFSLIRQLNWYALNKL